MAKQPTKAEVQADLDAANLRIEELEAQAVDPRLPHRYTEEGIAQRNAQLKAEGRLAPEGSPKISVGAEPFEKAMEERGDNFAEGREPWEVADAFGDTAAKHTPEGHTPRFLSPTHIDKIGMRGWEFVKDKDGRQVRQANMPLASMPIEKAEKRKAFFQEKTRRRTREVAEKHRETQERANAAGLGVSGNEISVARSRRVTDPVPA